MTALDHPAPTPATGSYAEGFHEVATTFASQVLSGQETGAALTIYQRGKKVVDLAGGYANARTKAPFRSDTRVVVFSVTKGLAAMALTMLADRGKLDFAAPVTTYWPRFGRAGKEGMSVRTLVNHRGGLAAIDRTLTMADCVMPQRAEFLLRALEEQRPRWVPEQGQGYHALTFGMYAAELFRRIQGESIGTFLRRELFEPLAADVSLGTPEEHDARIATLYPPGTAERVGNAIRAQLAGGSAETRIAADALRADSIARRAFLNPDVGARGIRRYDDLDVRRSELAWASATASADGIARAYLPFAGKGTFGGRAYLSARALEPLYARQGWSERDAVLQKPIGWSHGFVKEEPHLFSPVRESFGHPGMGGALGWCDPVNETTFAYVMNRMDSHVRSPRAIALCRAFYRSPNLRSA